VGKALCVFGALEQSLWWRTFTDGCWSVRSECACVCVCLQSWLIKQQNKHTDLNICSAL